MREGQSLGLTGQPPRRGSHSDRLSKEHPSNLSSCPQVHCLMIYPETTPVCQSASAPVCSMVWSMAPGRSQGQPAKPGKYRVQEVPLVWNLRRGITYLGAHNPLGTTPMPTCSQCTMGRWTCTEQPCPGHCSLEGGSFVTTFDARPYRFHGTCTYTLLQVGGALGLGGGGRVCPCLRPTYSLTSPEPAASQRRHPHGCV